MQQIKNRELSIIIDKTIEFLTDELDIKVNKIQINNSLKEIDSPLKSISSIHLSGNINSNIIFCISKDLIDKIATRFIPEGFSKSDTDAMLKDLPSEFINIIIGLSIQNFSKKNVSMSIPFIYEISQIKNILSKFEYQSITLKTDYGNITSIYVNQ